MNYKYMKLSKILDYLGLNNNLIDCNLNSIKLNSNQIVAGDLFIAIPGSSSDGRMYIQQAIERGAHAVLVEAPFNLENAVPQHSQAAVVLVANLSVKLAGLAAFFYDYPAKKMSVIGITGTNGKTSISYYLSVILGKQCGIIGTLGSGFVDSLKKTALTTPDVCVFNKELANLAAHKAQWAAVEVSSHALEQGRVAGVEFAIGVFTNLTRDHLEYHLSMEQYFTAKKKLFLEYNIKYAVINLDDEYGRRLAAELADTDIKLFGYTLGEHELKRGYLVKCYNISSTIQGICAAIHTPWGKAEIKSSALIGDFNLANTIAAIICAKISGMEFARILESVKYLTPAPGRMQFINQSAHTPKVVIDYAHTPDALLQVLKNLNQHCIGKLWCIFGCGGSRDRGKRPKMLQAALMYSDRIIITQDNSREEDPKSIVWDILWGTQLNAKITIELDRAKAINYAIAEAGLADIICIAGKGHEQFQIIGNKTVAFSDEKIARRALAVREEICT